MKITKAQQKAILRKYRISADGSPTYLHFRRRVQHGFDCLMIHWCGMWIGIEIDGYTHS